MTHKIINNSEIWYLKLILKIYRVKWKEYKIENIRIFYYTNLLRALLHAPYLIHREWRIVIHFAHYSQFHLLIHYDY